MMGSKVIKLVKCYFKNQEVINFLNKNLDKQEYSLADEFVYVTFDNDIDTSSIDKYEFTYEVYLKRELLKTYMLGFNDELYSKENRIYDVELMQNAYDLGSGDAIVGDDLPSFDRQSDDEIIKRIVDSLNEESMFINNALKRERVKNKKLDSEKE